MQKEKHYFANHAAWMNYKALADQGWPIGRGAAESAGCRSQGRRKGHGQFWTEPGVRHLSALEETRDFDHRDELWPTG